MAVGDGEGVNVAVGGIGVSVTVAVDVGSGVGVGAGTRGIQAANNTQRKTQYKERGTKVSLKIGFHLSLAKEVLTALA